MIRDDYYYLARLVAGCDGYSTRGVVGTMSGDAYMGSLSLNTEYGGRPAAEDRITVTVDLAAADSILAAAVEVYYDPMALSLVEGSLMTEPMLVDECSRFDTADGVILIDVSGVDEMGENAMGSSLATFELECIASGDVSISGRVLECYDMELNPGYMDGTELLLEAEPEDEPPETPEPTDAPAEPEPFDPMTTSGTCGEGVVWEIADGVLTISGQGEVTSSPWNGVSYEIINTVKSIVVEEGVTSLRDYAFAESFRSGISLSLPLSLTHIGRRVCDALRTGSVSYAGDEADWYAIDIDTGNGRLWESCGFPIHAEGTWNGFDWKLEDHDLTITGTGVLTWEDPGENEPWNEYNTYGIEGLTLGEGITAVGSVMFFREYSLLRVSLPKSLTSVGERAFCHCSELEEATYAGDWAKLTVEPRNGYLLRASGRPIHLSGSLGDLKWSLDEGVLTVTGTGSVGQGDHDAWPWDEMVWDNYITGAVLGEGITDLGQYLFSEHQRSLKTVSLPKSLKTVGTGAFGSYGVLESVSFDGDWYALRIGEENDLLWLASGYLPKESGKLSDTVSWSMADGVLTISGTGAAALPVETYSNYWGDEITRTVIPWQQYRNLISAVKVERGITSLGDDLFEQLYQVRSVTLPEGLTSIGKGVFEDMTLEAFNLPASVKSIADRAFRSATLSSVTYPGTEADFRKIYVSAGNGSLWQALGFTPEDSGAEAGIAWSVKDGVLTLSGRGDVSDYDTESGAAAPWYRYIELMDTVKVEEGITALGADSLTILSWSGTFRQLWLPESLTRIDVDVFGNLYLFEDTVVFYAGSEEQWDALDKGVEYSTISRLPVIFNAGADRDILTSGTWGDNLTWSIDKNGLLTVSGQGGMLERSGENYSWQRFRTLISGLKLEEGVTSVATSAMYSLGINELVLPDSVTSLGSNTFSYCTGLTRAVLPAGLAEVGNRMFMGCTALKDVTISEGIASVGKGAFRDCVSLTDIKLPASLTMVEYGAFAGCSGLKSVTIPATVKAIGGYMFDGSGVTDVYYGGSEEDWNAAAAAYVDLMEGRFKKDYAVQEHDFDGITLHFGSTGPAPAGDISGDGKVNRQDRIYLSRALAGWEDYPMPDASVADINRDGKVNRQDRIYLSRALAGWEGYSLGD